MGSSGLEPPTSRLSGVRSNRLSYEPILYVRYRKSYIRCRTQENQLGLPLPFINSSFQPLTFDFSLLIPDFYIGGDERIRTADPLLARQVLSQLSYTPMSWSLKTKQWLGKARHSFSLERR